MFHGFPLSGLHLCITRSLSRSRSSLEASVTYPISGERLIVSILYVRPRQRHTRCFSKGGYKDMIVTFCFARHFVPSMDLLVKAIRTLVAYRNKKLVRAPTTLFVISDHPETQIMVDDTQYSFIWYQLGYMALEHNFSFALLVTFVVCLPLKPW